MSADPRQLSLVLQAPAVDPAEDLRWRLEQSFGSKVERLILTRNRSRIASAKDTGGGWEIRLHHCFTEADRPTLDAVATFFTTSPGPKRRQALGVLREHFATHAPEREIRPSAVRAAGRHHDLLELRDSINRDYFADALELAITWGRAAPGRRRRAQSGFSIRLGSYEDSQRLVRIHPVLDRAEVPGYVVASVVYHEMLHAAVPPESHTTKTGERRRRVHNREFRRREQLFEHHEAAEAWLARNAEKLARWRAKK